MKTKTPILEKRVSKLKMLTGIEAEIINNQVQIRAKDLTLSEIDSIIRYCRSHKLSYSLESNLILKIS